MNVANQRHCVVRSPLILFRLLLVVAVAVVIEKAQAFSVASTRSAFQPAPLGPTTALFRTPNRNQQRQFCWGSPLVLAASSDDNNNNRDDSPSAAMVIVFGRPGAGKTTVANQAAAKLQGEVLALDLDVCVPQWMRDNFAKGMYPTLDERVAFAKDACLYVSEKQQQSSAITTTTTTTVVSFSFVNTDLRDVFREKFPSARWILIDTTEDEAQRRIDEREGHFYKVVATTTSSDEDVPVASVKDDQSKDNSDWDFAPVVFDHIALPGSNSIDENAKEVMTIVQSMLTQEVVEGSSSS